MKLKKQNIGLHISACLFVLVTLINAVHSESDEQRLAKKLLDKYEKLGTNAIPVNKSETLSLHFGVGLLEILDLHEIDQVLKTRLWLRYKWTDINLQWNPDDYGGVMDVKLPSSGIWVPDVTLFNSVSPSIISKPVLMEDLANTAIVVSDGTVLLIVQAVVESSCPIDVARFPFDEQTCVLKFVSLIYHGARLDLVLYDDLEEIDVSEYTEINEWTLVGHPAVKNVKYYPCCNEPYPDLTFILKLRRFCKLTTAVVVIPPILLSLSSALIFVMPANMSDRANYGIGIFAGFFLLLLLVSQMIPPVGGSIPRIGNYLIYNMILVSVAMLLSVLVSYVHDLPEDKPMPQRLSRMMNGIVGSLCCLKNKENQRSENRKTSFTLDTKCTKSVSTTLGITVDSAEARNKSGPKHNDWRLLSKLMDRVLMLMYLVLEIVFLAYFSLF